jgi:peptidoglycan-associated lipoprotein
MRSVIIAVLCTAGLLTFAACSTTPEDQTAQADPAKPGATKPGATKPGVQAVTPPKVAAVDVSKPRAAEQAGALKDPGSILSKRQIFFDYDKFDVKEEYRPLVEAHAKYLRENPNAKMLIQGNADERGSREYNLALGQKRSDNVKKMLMLLGARESQLESVSLGEEKPMCNDHTEDCWAKNRRGEMLYGGEY